MTLQARVDKEPPDITRIVVDMAWWLDVNEIFTEIVSSEVIQGMSGWSEAPYPPPDSSPPYDPTPLLLREVLLDATHRQLIIFVEFGTSGVAYTLRFVLDGSSNRRITFEVGVQVTGVPPEQPLPLPPLPPDAAGQQPGDQYLNIKGGTMLGPLYLFQDPFYPTEAATKAYVDGTVAGATPGGSFMPTSGGTFTGPVTMGSTLTLVSSTPTNPLDAASKAYVDSMSASAGVTSFNTRQGAVTLVTKDVTDAGGALVQSPTFLGIPAAPTATTGTISTQIATTAFVKSTMDTFLVSPAFTGNPTAPTPTAGDNDTSIATTAFVTAAVVASTTGVSSVNGRTGAVTLVTKDITDAGGLIAAVTTFNTRAGPVTLVTKDITDAGGAVLASPIFTGNPTSPTPAPGDNDTSIATTAFVKTAVNTAFTGTGRNLIHNSMFHIAQRGPGPFNVNGYTLDRWFFSALGGSTFNTSQQPITDAQRLQIGDENAGICLGTTFSGAAAADAYVVVFQPIENVLRLTNKVVTVSFYAVATGALKLGVSLDQTFGTGGGSPSATVNGVGQSVTLGTSYARYSLTFTTGSLATKSLGDDRNSATALFLWFSSGTNTATRSGGVGVQSGTVNLWGVQVEVGAAATPLEKPDPRYDLDNCMRFFQNVDGDIQESTSTAGFTIGHLYPFTAPMRAAPTFTLTSVPFYFNASGATAQPVSNRAWQMIATPTAAGGWIARASFAASADL